ncbi:hypothetical protein OBBRIDRAFT_157587 [Obba rivulosa]|uniref:Uncharacterized protein n=1 Tax=Obba rivulosa TaxID=1052685 RepID=A0A8E2AMJ1_9APHY|nr:hypothetical protein OBBRIDRAFT_157587 [Obba rivulosa]
MHMERPTDTSSGGTLEGEFAVALGLRPGYGCRLLRSTCPKISIDIRRTRLYRTPSVSDYHNNTSTTITPILTACTMFSTVDVPKNATCGSSTCSSRRVQLRQVLSASDHSSSCIRDQDLSLWSLQRERRMLAKEDVGSRVVALITLISIWR